MNGVNLITNERQRQIDLEGYNAEHDDYHQNGALAIAAAAYIYSALGEGSYKNAAIELLAGAFEIKPSTPLKDLVKAGALVAAEIDRRLRAGERE